MTDSILTLRQQGSALWATLNRPAQLNALNLELIAELHRLFLGLRARRDVRVVVLTGAGRAFCAGLDLKDYTTQLRPTRQALEEQRNIADIVVAMRRCPQPIVALLNGPASGGGFALALAADVRIVTPEARMNAAFIKIGLSACDIGVSYFLPRMVGSSVAAEYLLTGRFFTPQRALALGLVSEVVASEELVARGETLVAELLAASPVGLQLTKEALNVAVDAGGLEAVIAMEDRNQVLTSQHCNFEEGVRAFLEKRPPRYSDD
jgi:enoyl-CoA hydratase/carnithine racemase